MKKFLDIKKKIHFWRPIGGSLASRLVREFEPLLDSRVPSDSLHNI